MFTLPHRQRATTPTWDVQDKQSSKALLAVLDTAQCLHCSRLCLLHGSLLALHLKAAAWSPAVVMARSEEAAKIWPMPRLRAAVKIFHAGTKLYRALSTSQYSCAGGR